GADLLGLVPSLLGQRPLCVLSMGTALLRLGVTHEVEVHEVLLARRGASQPPLSKLERAVADSRDYPPRIGRATRGQSWRSTCSTMCSCGSSSSSSWRWRRRA